MKFNINLTKDHETQIGAHKIKVKFVSPDDPHLNEDHGAYVPKEYTIYLNEDDPKSIKFSSYLHETLHVIEHLFIFELDHKILNLIAEGFAQILFKDEEKQK